MQERWGGRVVPSLLRKPKGLGSHNKRLLALLRARIGEEVPLRELMLHNGFSPATARRLRELKLEQGGFRIEARGTGHSARYVLRDEDPDLDKCSDYWLKNNIRRSDLSVDERLLALLKARMPEKVTIQEFRYVNPSRKAANKGRARASQSSTDRRVRDLREAGWQVYSHHDGVVAGLRTGEYVMTTLQRVPAYERLRPQDWHAVLERTGYRCADCGWGRADGTSQGRKLLEVHHMNPQRAKPNDVNDLSNLEPLCNVCHDARP